MVVVSDCVFDGKGTSLASQHAIAVSQSTLTMTATTIQNISSADGESSNGVVLHDAAGAFTRSTFASLASSAVGGAVHAALSSSTSLTITSCSMESCWSEGNGGTEWRRAVRRSVVARSRFVPPDLADLRVVVQVFWG
ncbi:hypothetical protein BLNAU_21667 [Blattamonas nauphoetae]|uniref:Uncharacterized protein n=1 Tax=Blattamonas nauphoetae TaxID=2049346 RepID=A0ABQ9WV94_9EUKA|nr:hypothetical protein BLNAU_21667 [Blattamonas nauphoetae]